MALLGPPKKKFIWDSGSPLSPQNPPDQWDPIPKSTLKTLPKFSEEEGKNPA